MWARAQMRKTVFSLLALTAGINFLASTAGAQVVPSSDRAIDYQKSGIRFQIKASIKAVPGAPYLKREDDRTRASLDLKLRISAHAMGSNYFGVNSETFSDFRLAEGSEEKLFWQDDRCHQRRGLPKLTVTAIDGSIQAENGRIDVVARPRLLGKKLPADEISAGMPLPSGVNKNGQFIAFSAKTSASYLVVNVKVYTFDCLLGTTRP
jgi:hypothetical protein